MSLEAGKVKKKKKIIPKFFLDRNLKKNSTGYL